MTVQWFPGHMAKARRQIQEKLNLVDIVIELLDARLPLASQNPMIQEIIADKPKIVLLNKADLADPQGNKAWIEYFKGIDITAITVNSQTGDGLQNITKEAQKLMEHKSQKLLDKGFNPKAIRAMIIGIPNVGKSTLINKLANKTIAQTSDKPGVTKKQQWIKVGTEMELLDTPGILWPKFDDEEIGYRLAVSGAIKEEVFDFEAAGYYLIKFLKDRYSELLKERYKLQELSDDPYEILQEIGKKRGCLRSGGVVDTTLAGEILLRDYRSQKLGKITLEFPE
ncbi:ribosome biogenesis GTPase YlqF [Desulfuribacillus alkaliarsenatis]|uniref:Ribosome biogenesis GTPase A n=1 Tax=Desulfuribacillus alkaliarsenatis TaxID=766136 RepID=A0A1E5G755_9FIRM|nr:ribosome biogenesis GTPase YlqF [Desulfuribacillus alkaliarsenatis]OEF98574.1 ribosome biogenesis GTPase YlqF [Desulfuribacillus alkaliarsenatis]